MLSQVTLLGVDLADLDARAAAFMLAARPAAAPFGYVLTPNADNLVRLSRDPAFAAIYRTATIRLLNSRVVARAARLLGLRTPAIAPGSDLTARLLVDYVDRHERVTVVGLRPEYLDRLTEQCAIARPHHHNPPIGFERDPAAFAEAVAFVLAHPARFVFLAVGSPRQEMLAAAIQATGQATGLGLCIGASLDFLAGAATRAPAWMQRAGLEWLHRLLGDPKRLARRYLIDNPPIFALLLRERLGRRA